MLHMLTMDGYDLFCWPGRVSVEGPVRGESKQIFLAERGQEYTLDRRYQEQEHMPSLYLANEVGQEVGLVFVDTIDREAAKAAIREALKA